MTVKKTYLVSAVLHFFVSIRLPLRGLAILLAAVFTFFPSAATYAQSKSDPRWTIFAQQRDGLISNDVSAILVTDGGLWFGTSEGISFYNGAWTSYPSAPKTDNGELGQYAPDGRVRALAGAEDGVGVWAGTDAGQIARWDGLGWSPVAQTDAPVYALHEIEGALWIGTERGLLILEDGIVSQASDANAGAVHAILADGDSVWIGANTGLWRVRNGEWEPIAADDDLFSNGAYSLWLEEDGSLWVGTSSGIAWREARGQVWRYKEILDEIGVPAPVQALAGDGEGVIWAGTDGAGAVSYQRLTQKLTTYGIAGDPNLTTRFVRGIGVDQDGSVWMATTAGVFRYQVKAWYGDIQGSGIDDPLNYVNDLLVDRGGTLWIATGGAGVRRKVGVAPHETVYDEDDGLPGSILALEEDARGNIWAGGFEGVHRYSAGRWRRVPGAGGLSSSTVTDLLAEGNGIWIGLEGGLSHYDLDTFRLTEQPALSGQTVEALALDSENRLWVGTEEHGITIRQSDGSWQQFLHDPADPASLPANQILGSGLSPDLRTKGGMWAIFGDAGLARWDGSQWEVDQYGHYLPSNLLWTVYTDPETGDLWVGSEGGVSRFDGQTWGTFGANDGLLSPITYAVERSPQGGYWIGGRTGLSHYLPEHTPPWVKITGINEISEAERGQAAQIDAPITAKENVLIEFDAGDLQTPQNRLRLLYRLSAPDAASEWREISPGIVRTSFAAPGSYLVEFLVRDQSFNYSEVAEQRVQVLPPQAMIDLPFLGKVERSIFQTLVILAVLAFGGATYVSLEIIQNRARSAEALNRGYNPYVSGEPVRRDDMFFGRHDLVQRIVDTLHNNSIMIHGERRIGKTTLLYQLASVLRAVDDKAYWFFPLYVDLEGTPQEHFFHSLIEEIADGAGPLLRETSQAVDTIQHLRYHTIPYGLYTDRDFNRDLREVIHALHDYGSVRFPGRQLRLILLLDEMDVMSHYDHLIQQQLRRIFMREFASTMGAVVAGIQISKEWDRVESPWFNLFNEVALEPFTREQARELLVEPVREYYAYDPAAIEFILDQSDGRPFRIQQYGLEAVNQMLADGRRRITLDDAEAAHRGIQLHSHEATEPNGDTGGDSEHPEDSQQDGDPNGITSDSAAPPLGASAVGEAGR